ncbi:MAG: hypothetical protein PVF15_07465 [Candidatus Bathyarchaeota archaeon]|jgi:hypothetical protein
MIGLLISILALVAAGSAAYLLTVVDTIVHGQLYEFGLIFSLDWANPYWTVFRMIQVLLGIIAAASSMNIAFSFWKMLKGPRVTKVVHEETKAELVPQTAGVPSLFRCTSCGRNISHPLRMLDFQSQRPKMVNVCPFCNATVVPSSYTYTEKTPPATEEQEIEQID